MQSCAFHEKINANIDRIPPNIATPQIIGRGINDVPIVTLTLTPKELYGGFLERYFLAHDCQ